MTVSTDGVSFKYDPLGRRIYKSSSSGTSVFVYDGGSAILPFLEIERLVRCHCVEDSSERSRCFIYLFPVESRSCPSH